MSHKTLFEEYMEDEEFARYMAQEELIMEVTEVFCALLEREKTSKATLAKKMGRTKGYISQLLKGGKNLTLRSISDLAFSLGQTVQFQIKQRDEKCNVSSFVTDFSRKKRSKKVFAKNKITFADDYFSRSRTELAG